MHSQPIRIESETLAALRERSAETGEPIVRLAQRSVDEGMRLDRHPGIVFRGGPTGRRPAVAGGPDVWEVVSAARSAPERGDELDAALAERVGSSSDRIRVAVHYYAEFPDEIDRWIERVVEEAERTGRRPRGRVIVSADGVRSAERRSAERGSRCTRWSLGARSTTSSRQGRS